MLTRLHKAASIYLFLCVLIASGLIPADADPLEPAKRTKILCDAEGPPPSSSEAERVRNGTDEPQSEPGTATVIKSEHGVQRDLSNGWSASTKAYNVAVPADTHIKEHSEARIEIESGTIFIEAVKPTTVVTPLAEYSIKPKGLVLLRVNKGAERVLAMLEGLTLVTAKRSTELRFGEEALVTEHQPSHGELVGEEEIGIRQLRTQEVSHNRHIAIAEFSLIQATERIPLVSRVIHSGHAHDKALKSRLLKTQAVLNMVTSTHGYYSGSH